MKSLLHKPLTRSRPRGWGERAFTLTEIMVTMAILMVVLAGVLTSHLFGLRMFEITKAKLGASDQARMAIQRLIDEIRSAKTVRIGNGNLISFTEIPDGSLQQGTAIQICATTNTNYFVRYFFDTNDRSLKRATNGAYSAMAVAQFITNTVIFTSENFGGAILTENQNNRVIGLTLQFYQIRYPVIQIGPGNYYDFYQLRTKITRRVLE